MTQEDKQKKPLTPEDFKRFKFSRPPRDCAPRQKDGTPTFN